MPSRPPRFLQSRLVIEELTKRSRVLTAFFATKVMTRVAPDLAAWCATQVWFTPLRTKKISSLLRPKNNVNLSNLVRNQSPHLAKGKTVLLIHGWAGSSQQFSKIASQLSNQGFKIASFDSKAHGQSTGITTDIVEMTDQLSAVVKSIEGSFDVITHSFGLLVLSQLLRSQSHQISSLVALAAPSSLDYLMSQFFKETQISSSLKESMLIHIQNRVGHRLPGPSEIEVRDSDLRMPRILFIHDQDDKQVNFSELEKLSKKFPASQKLVTRGLGHNRLLVDDSIISQISDFIK